MRVDGLGAMVGAVLISCTLGAIQAMADTGYNVRISAGKLDRQQAVVSFALPRDAAKGPWRLRDEQGKTSAVDVDGQGQATFILDRLPAGATRELRLEHDAAPARAVVQVVKEAGELRATVGGKEILRYRGADSPLPPGFADVYRRNGYIHPLYTPAGRLISDDYPPNHRHHHGIWSPWTKTEFEGRHPDFWNMGDRTGTVLVSDFGGEFGGAACGGFVARHQQVDLSATPARVALNEQWTVRIYAVENRPRPGFLFDLDIRQDCASASPLILPKYLYGGLGFRGNRQWDGAGKTTFLTSEGKTVADGNETRGRWCYIGGKVDGQPAGVAILCHPDNFRAPQPMRLHPSEPFFCYAPPQLGEFRIEPGKPYVTRYRFVVFDGEPDAGFIERMWKEYAEPVTVEVK